MSAFKEEGVSLYHRIESEIREKIESGEWVLGSKLPTENELSTNFGASRTTIRRAVQGMVDAGLLIRRKGSGTYIAKSAYARNRLSNQPSEAVCKYIYSPLLTIDYKLSFKNMLRIVEAHTMMLAKQKIINVENCCSTLRAIEPLYNRPASSIGVNPLNEDCFLNLEQYLISTLGVETGSDYLLARSRNDMTPTMLRMSTRDAVIKIYARLLNLIRRVCDLSLDYQGCVLTGYTHWQPAYPITLDFYLLGIAEALERDSNRLINSYASLNLSPLGAYSFAGSSYPIDRNYTASLLGFDGLVLNALDAVASRDFLLEITANYSTLGSTLSRFATDLYLWATEEFGYTVFSDSTSCCSSSMPQKKNPLSVEHIKSKTSHLTSSYLDLVMSLKGTTFSHSRDLFECTTTFFNATDEMIAALDLFSDMLEGIKFNVSAMEVSVNKHNLSSTEIVNYLTRVRNVPFRSAHGIVGLAINETKKQNSKLTPESLADASKKICGTKFFIPDDVFEELNNAASLIEKNVSQGGTSAGSCKLMYSLMSNSLSEDYANVNLIKEKLKASSDMMRSHKKEVLASVPAI